MTPEAPNMTTNAANITNTVNVTTGAVDLRPFQRRSYSGNLAEQAAFERMVTLSNQVALQLRSHGPGVVAEIAGQVCWVSTLFTADEPLVSALGKNLEHTEFTYAIFPSHTDDLNAQELDDISDEIERWLAQPRLLPMNQQRLDEALAVIIERWTDDDSRNLL